MSIFGNRSSARTGKAGRTAPQNPRSAASRFGAHHRNGRLAALAVLLVLALLAWRLDDREAIGPAPGQTAPGLAYALTGKVTEVAGGDTVAMRTADGRQRIRLASIDAPERDGRDRPGQPHADASRRHLAQMVEGRTVTARCFEQDRYERHICDLVLDDGQTANRRQVEAGMAWANQEGRGKFLRDAEMPGLEQQARQAGKGLWQAGQGEPVRPWEWRYRCWQQGQCG